MNRLFGPQGVHNKRTWLYFELNLSVMVKFYFARYARLFGRTGYILLQIGR